jgi:tetratricopeptide (TPR) repeat protein
VSISKKKWTGIIAILSVVVLLAAYFPLQEISRATITRRQAGEKNSAAANYLVDQTEYVHESGLKQTGHTVESFLFGPATAEDYYLLASARIARENFPEALEYVGRCLEMYTGTDPAVLADLWLKKGCLCAILGDRQGALNGLDKALEYNPQSPDAYLVKSQVYVEMEENPQALESMKRYFELAPDPDAYRLTLAQLMAAQNDITGAREQLTYLVDKGLKDAQVYALRGAGYFQTEVYTLAEADFNQCIDLGGGTKDIYYYRGICRMMAEKYREAAADFVSAASCGMAGTEYLQALCRYQSGDYEKALPILAALVKQGSKDENVFFYHGVCCMKTVDYPAAIQSLTQSIEKGEMVQASYYNRAMCYVKQNDLNSALKDFEIAAKSGDDEEIKKLANDVLDQAKAAQK